MKEIESEKQLERLLKSTVENTMQGLCLKLLSQHTTGLPDRLCLLPKEKAFFVEVKSKGKKPRKIQEFIHRKLRDLGFRVYVLDSVIGLDTILNDYGYHATYGTSQRD